MGETHDPNVMTGVELAEAGTIPANSTVEDANTLAPTRMAVRFELNLLIIFPPLFTF